MEGRAKANRHYRGAPATFSDQKRRRIYTSHYLGRGVIWDTAAARRLSLCKVDADSLWYLNVVEFGRSAQFPCNFFVMTSQTDENFTLWEWGFDSMQSIDTQLDVAPMKTSHQGGQPLKRHAADTLNILAASIRLSGGTAKQMQKRQRSRPCHNRKVKVCAPVGNREGTTFASFRAGRPGHLYVSVQATHLERGTNVLNHRHRLRLTRSNFPTGRPFWVEPAASDLCPFVLSPLMMRSFP